MGVFTEAFKRCPFCEDGVGVAQVAEGWGLFLDLDDLEGLEHRFTDEELDELHKELRDKAFRCSRSRENRMDPGADAGCGEFFYLEEALNFRRSKAQQLFG